MKDYTGLGLFDEAYSYHRPAAILANALMNGMTRAGLSEREALSLLYSKAYRWTLDGQLGDELAALGLKHGAELARDFMGDEWTRYQLPQHRLLKETPAERVSP